MFDLILKKFLGGLTPSDSAYRAKIGSLSGLTGIILNVLLFVSKAAVGLLSGSVSVIADSVNNLSDASSSVISLIGFRLAEKPADVEHPYGHGRYEYLAGLTVTILILVIGVELARSSIIKIITPAEVELRAITLIVLAFSILVKGFMMFFNKYLGGLIGSKTLLATASDSRNDVITSFAVALAALASHFFSIDLDGWAGLAVALFILYSAFGLIRDTLDPLLGRSPDPEFVEHIHKTIMSYPGVLGTHDLMIHDYGPGRMFASAHVEMAAENDVCESHDVIDNIENDFHDKENLHIVLHFDPIMTSDGITGDMRRWLSQEVKILDPIMSIHDLRIVSGPTHSNLIFDIVVPPSYRQTNAEVKAAVSALVKKSYPNYKCVITVDHSFIAAPDR